jgi:hypothetical protein
METTFHYDGEAWPFSTCSLHGLRACYAPDHGKWLAHPKWRGDFEAINDTISVNGIGDLYGAVSRLSSSDPVVEIVQSKVVGASYLAMLVHLAGRDFAPRDILLRPTAVLDYSNQDYPFYNAPVFAAR